MKIEDLKLKYSYRAMMLWESVMGKPFGTDNTITSMVVLLWCIIEASNNGKISLEDFMKWVDDEPAEFNQLCKWLAEEKQRQAMLMGDTEDSKVTEDVKKKTLE